MTDVDSGQLRWACAGNRTASSWPGWQLREVGGVGAYVIGTQGVSRDEARRTVLKELAIPPGEVIT
jgi:hypothetical protein